VSAKFKVGDFVRGISYNNLIKNEPKRRSMDLIAEGYPQLGKLLQISDVHDHYGEKYGVIYFFYECSCGMYEDDLIEATEFKPLLNALSE
jgi:hypothetical protein